MFQQCWAAELSKRWAHFEGATEKPSTDTTGLKIPMAKQARAQQGARAQSLQRPACGHAFCRDNSLTNQQGSLDCSLLSPSLKVLTTFCPISVHHCTDVSECLKGVSCLIHLPQNSCCSPRCYGYDSASQSTTKEPAPQHAQLQVFVVTTVWLSIKWREDLVFITPARNKSTNLYTCPLEICCFQTTSYVIP